MLGAEHRNMCQLSCVLQSHSNGRKCNKKCVKCLEMTCHFSASNDFTFVDIFINFKAFCMENGELW